MSKVKITLVRSQIKRPTNQRDTLTALGLRKVNSSVEHELTPQIQGMIDVVGHIVAVEKA